MRIFISWSGIKSLEVAKSLHHWFPFVINALEPWMSSEDIDKGQRWGLRLSEQLENTKVGIICLTRENLNAPWILFEAGALSKTLESTFVCPYLFDIEPSDLKGPLAQFQSTKAEKEDTKQLIKTINKALGHESLNEGRLIEIFERWWPDLEDEFGKTRKEHQKEKKLELSEREMLKEILLSVRQQKETVSMILTKDDN